MRNARKDFNPIHELYQLKKLMLVYERVFSNYPTEDLLPIGNIQIYADFVECVYRMQKILLDKIVAAELSDEEKAYLAEHKCFDWLQMSEFGDFDRITEVYHGNACFNEIPNGSVLEKLLSIFKRIWRIADDGDYFIEVYDLNDYDLHFPNEAQMKDFINIYDVCPYVAFAHRDGIDEVLWSE